MRADRWPREEIWDNWDDDSGKESGYARGCDLVCIQHSEADSRRRAVEFGALWTKCQISQRLKDAWHLQVMAAFSGLPKDPSSLFSAPPRMRPVNEVANLNKHGRNHSHKPVYTRVGAVLTSKFIPRDIIILISHLKIVGKRASSQTFHNSFHKQGINCRWSCYDLRGRFLTFVRSRQWPFVDKTQQRSKGEVESTAKSQTDFADNFRLTVR